MAQEVQKVYPEAVSKGTDGFFAVSYSNLVAPIIEAIKELKVEISNLKRSPASSEEVLKLKKENAMMRDYLCKKDPQAPFCKN